MRPMSCATSWESEYRRTVSTSSAYTEEQRRCCLGHISYIRRQKAQRWTVNTAGAKHVVLPLLAASIMGSGETVLHNCPALSDVYAMLGILEAAGCRTDFNGGRVRVCPGISEEAFLHEDSGERAALFRISSGTYAGAEAFGSYGISRWLRHR